MTQITLSLRSAIVVSVVSALLIATLGGIVYMQNFYTKPPPPPEVGTRNVHVIWQDDKLAEMALEEIRQRRSYRTLVCVFHPQCGHSQQFTPALAEAAAKIDGQANVLKIYPQNMQSIQKHFESINIRGYPTLLLEHRHAGADRFVEEYTDKSNSMQFRSAESVSAFALS